MADNPKPPPDWKHNQEVSFNGLKEVLVVVKTQLEATIAAKKQELQNMIRARDSLRK